MLSLRNDDEKKFLGFGIKIKKFNFFLDGFALMII